MNITHVNTTFAVKQGHWMALLGSKKTWLRVNRVLAWSLIVSPVLQLLLRTNLVNGLLLDLAILVVHAGLSLWLFGAPKVTSAVDTHWMRWLGVSYNGLTTRNRFLLSGWRVMLSMGAQMLLALMVWFAAIASAGLHWIPEDLITLLVFALLLLITTSGSFYGLMMLYAIVSHIFGAGRYALRRWGLSNAYAKLLAGLLVATFMVMSIANLFKTV